MLLGARGGSPDKRRGRANGIDGFVMGRVALPSSDRPTAVSSSCAQRRRVVATIHDQETFWIDAYPEAFWLWRTRRSSGSLMVWEGHGVILVWGGLIGVLVCGGTGGDVVLGGCGCLWFRVDPESRALELRTDPEMIGFMTGPVCVCDEV